MAKTHEIPPQIPGKPTSNFTTEPPPQLSSLTLHKPAVEHLGEVLGEAAIGNLGEELAALHELHHHVDARARGGHIVEEDDVGVAEALYEGDSRLMLAASPTFEAKSFFLLITFTATLRPPQCVVDLVAAEELPHLVAPEEDPSGWFVCGRSISGIGLIQRSNSVARSEWDFEVCFLWVLD